MHRYEMSLMDACRSLHMALTGAGDWDPPRMKEWAEFIRMRLSMWEEISGAKWVAFDNAVKAMAEAVLVEYEASPCG